MITYIQYIHAPHSRSEYESCPRGCFGVWISGYTTQDQTTAVDCNYWYIYRGCRFLLNQNAGNSWSNHLLREHSTFFFSHFLLENIIDKLRFDDKRWGTGDFPRTLHHVNIVTGVGVGGGDVLALLVRVYSLGSPTRKT